MITRPGVAGSPREDRFPCMHARFRWVYQRLGPFAHVFRFKRIILSAGFRIAWVLHGHLRCRYPHATRLSGACSSSKRDEAQCWSINRPKCFSTGLGPRTDGGTTPLDPILGASNRASLQTTYRSMFPDSNSLPSLSRINGTRKAPQKGMTPRTTKTPTVTFFSGTEPNDVDHAFGRYFGNPRATQAKAQARGAPLAAHPSFFRGCGVYCWRLGGVDDWRNRRTQPRVTFNAGLKE